MYGLTFGTSRNCRWDPDDPCDFLRTKRSFPCAVRLSYVAGTVGVKRPASSEWAKAQVNTPIQEGLSFSTSKSSFAEVEFENGSTVRLGEYSKVAFEQLAIDENGNKLNHLTFEQGYATFHFLPEHHDAYSVKVADATLTPSGKSEFRTDLQRGKSRVEVFQGSVEVATAAKTVKLGKDKVLDFDPISTEASLDVKQGIDKDSWDKWTSARDTQAQLSLNDQAVSAGGSVYGWSDLNAYGEWGFFSASGTAGRLMRRPAGRLTAMACGACTPAWVTPGLAANPGAGCLTTTVPGISTPGSAGSGCLQHGRILARLGELVFRTRVARLGAAGRHGRGGT